VLLDTPLWRQTPPAAFPVCLGFLSLAVAWTHAANVLPWVSEDMSNLLLAAATGYFLWFFGFYIAKVIARPAVLTEDMRTPPARAGIAAMAMAMMLLALALLPFNLYVPQVWWTGVVLQIAASAIVLHAIWLDPPEKRHFSTFQYLTFVGPVIGPFTGVPLGYIWESYWLIMASLVAYVIVTIGILVTLKRDPIPKALRPSITIFLAPLCLFALGFDALGEQQIFVYFYWASNVAAAGLLLLAPWMMRGGYTPVWAAFTFPVAAYLNVQVVALANGHGFYAMLGTYAAMAIGTPLILYMVYRTVMEWVTGDLAKKSHAASA
jgi:tellurite resistance protein